jgi:hypothetical protein
VALGDSEAEVTQSGSPTVRRRRLAAELRRLRGSRTGTEIARGVGWSPTKISRAESGRESIPPHEVEKLLDYYGVTGPLRQRLLGLAEDATQRGWWDKYADVLTPEFTEFIGLEAEAEMSLQYQADAVPGLLQTEDYTRRLNDAYRIVAATTPPSVLERVLQVRMIRQQSLIRTPPLQLSVIIDEAVLLRRVGDNTVMRVQLERLAEATKMPNVDLRILPLNRGVSLVTASFVIMTFGSRATAGAADLGDVVSTENLTTELYTEGETDTFLYRRFFQALTAASLPPDASRELLRSTIEHSWS